MLAFALSACAVGNKHEYAATPLSLEAGAGQSIALAVQDQRPYVRDGDKSPDFVGLQRGGFGNPFDVTTESRKPLADDFATAIAAGLMKYQAKTTIVPAAVSATSDAVLADLQKSGAARLLILALREWKSDTYQNTSLLYDVTLSVYDQDGRRLTEKSAQGDDNLGGAFNSPAHAKEVVPTAFARILADLFRFPEIEAALR